MHRSFPFALFNLTLEKVTLRFFGLADAWRSHTSKAGLTAKPSNCSSTNRGNIGKPSD
jgi:hypothetical protein